jgi:hypothetical protein
MLLHTNRLKVAMAGAVGLAVGGLLAGGVVASGASGDPCDQSYVTPMDSTQKLKLYNECRFDRIEAKLNALGPTASPSSSASSVAPTSSPTATTTAAPSASSSTPVAPARFPDATNTGVPLGTALTAYTGPTTITTAGTVIDRKQINQDLVIKAAGVKITNSSMSGRIISNTAGASVAVSDSKIDGGRQETFPTISYARISLLRVNVVGGQHSVQCSTTCTIIDSWLHDQYLPSGSSGHVNAFISNGGGPFTLRHNTLHCTAAPTAAGGCSAQASLFGDFGQIHDVALDGNLFKSSHAGYCLHAGYHPSKPYGSNPTNVKVTNNTFERGSTGKCGLYGPVTAFLNANGNTFTGNRYTDGTAITP